MKDPYITPIAFSKLKRPMKRVSFQTQQNENISFSVRSDISDEELELMKTAIVAGMEKLRPEIEKEIQVMEQLP